MEFMIPLAVVKIWESSACESGGAGGRASGALV